MSFNFLGDVLTNKNQLDAAQAALREGEEIYRKTLGENNVYLVNNLTSQGYMLYAKGDRALVGRPGGV